MGFNSGFKGLKISSPHT